MLPRSHPFSPGTPRSVPPGLSSCSPRPPGPGLARLLRSPSPALALLKEAPWQEGGPDCCLPIGRLWGPPGLLPDRCLGPGGHRELGQHLRPALCPRSVHQSGQLRVLDPLVPVAARAGVEGPPAASQSSYHLPRPFRCPLGSADASLPTPFPAPPPGGAAMVCSLSGKGGAGGGVSCSALSPLK